MNQELASLVDKARRVVFFGGAGVSCESGIPDFRSQDGLYHQQYAYPPEEILSHHFFCAASRGILPFLPRQNALSQGKAE